MRHQKHSAFVGCKIALEPLYGLYVEVVGRLVEEYEIGMAQQNLGQFHTHLPSAAEFGYRTVEIAVAEAQPKQHLFGHLATVIAPQHGDTFHTFVVAVEQLLVFAAFVVGAVGNLLGELLQLRFEGVDVREGRKGFVEHTHGAVGNHLLRQVAHALAFGNDDGARFGLLLPRNDFHQGRFAGAVLTHKANTVAVGNVESYVVEKVGAGKLYR